MRRYETMRRADVMSRTIAVDLLNRSLLSGFLPMQALRGLGLHLLGNVGPLRRAIMREGVMPGASQPRLMRGEALTLRQRRHRFLCSGAIAELRRDRQRQRRHGAAIHTTHACARTIRAR